MAGGWEGRLPVGNQVLQQTLAEEEHPDWNQSKCFCFSFSLSFIQLTLCYILALFSKCPKPVKSFSQYFFVSWHCAVFWLFIAERLQRISSDGQEYRFPTGGRHLDSTQVQGHSRLALRPSRPQPVPLPGSGGHLESCSNCRTLSPGMCCYCYIFQGDYVFRSVCLSVCLFIWGFCVTFNTVQVISQRVVGRAEETSTYSSSGFCTVNCRPTASNYQLSHLRSGREPNPGLRGGRRECYHSATVAPFVCVLAIAPEVIKASLWNFYLLGWICVCPSLLACFTSRLVILWCLSLWAEETSTYRLCQYRYILVL